MYKYYYNLNEDDISIAVLGKSKILTKNCIQISEQQYEEYNQILRSIPDKEGFEKRVTLYVDGTFDVSYAEIDIDS